MKPSSKQSRHFSFGFLIIATLALVSWSPPSNEDILMSTGTPAVVIGTGNVVDGYTSNPAGGLNGTAFRGVVAGNSNYCGTGGSSSYSVVVGNSNIANVVSSVVAGNSNTVANGATSFGTSVRYSGIFGYSNVVPQNRYSLVVAGASNSVDAYESFVAGSGNTLNGGTVGTPTYQSSAIGYLNNVNATHGYAVGYQCTVSGDYGVAIGSGAQASKPYSTALGRYNSPMAAGDVLVVGNGTDNNNQSTALTVTDDGGVILGRAQGDVSMGAYN